MKLISPESLTNPQRETLRSYTPFFPQGAVCVNVLLGSESWDVRPLLLINGKVHLCRFSMKLEEVRAKRLADELAGFSVLFQNRQRSELLAGEGRVMLLRPYEQSTLADDLEGGAVGGQHSLSGIVRQLIQLVSTLSRRSITHGHLSPANIAFVNGEIAVLDPVFGALHLTSDTFLPPESELGILPEPFADLYSLGRIIKLLLGDSLTARQAAIVEQLLLPSPKQRPPLVEVAVAFGVPDGPASREGGDSGAQASGGGRLVRPGTHADTSRTAEPRVLDGIDKQRAEMVKRKPLRIVVGMCAAVLIAGWIVKDRRPELYYKLAAYIPLLAPQHSVEYEIDWASRERARMAIVARAAALHREPAAINTIVTDLRSGSNPEGVRAAFMRVAFSELWRNELSDSDVHATLTWGLAGLASEGNETLPPLNELHPGVLLALVGQGQFVDKAGVLQKVSVSSLTKLPEPFGPLFAQLEAMGVKTMADPRAVGLARVVCGDMGSSALRAFIGDGLSAPETLAKVATILPVVAGSSQGVQHLVDVLQDSGGDIAALLGWFDLLDLAQWSSVTQADKLRMIVGVDVPSTLRASQWADLLSFPLAAVRSRAVEALQDAFPDGHAEKVLLLLSSPGVAFTREQIIALVSALQLPEDKRVEFVPAWFELKPSPDAVLLLLLARATASTNDLLNLEAARYLRRATWKANIDELRLLARHSEPLARALAYGKLRPENNDERAILMERKSSEQDPGCQKVLEEKLRGYTK